MSNPTTPKCRENEAEEQFIEDESLNDGKTPFATFPSRLINPDSFSNQRSYLLHKEVDFFTGANYSRDPERNNQNNTKNSPVDKHCC